MCVYICVCTQRYAYVRAIYTYLMPPHVCTYVYSPTLTYMPYTRTLCRRVCVCIDVCVRSSMSSRSKPWCPQTYMPCIHISHIAIHICVCTQRYVVTVKAMVSSMLEALGCGPGEQVLTRNKLLSVWRAHKAKVETIVDGRDRQHAW